MDYESFDDDSKELVALLTVPLAVFSFIFFVGWLMGADIERKETPHVCTDEVFILRVGDDLECNEDQNLIVKGHGSDDNGVVITCICKTQAQ